MTYPTRKLDTAARAAWLYYIKRRTQDEIATELNVSRQNAQRLIAYAISEGLIKFRLDHPLADCLALAQRLQDRFGLLACEVVPHDRVDPRDTMGIAIAAAFYLEGFLAQKVPLTLAIGTGRTLRGVVLQVSSMEQPQHKIVSVVGNLTRDGRASPYDVVMRLADRVGAQCYPMPTPVVCETVEERRVLQAQRGYQTVRQLIAEARVVVLGIGGIGWQAPLHADGFVNDAEIAEMMERGAVGEIVGWPYDRDGRFLTTPVTERMSAIPLTGPPDRPMVVVACGAAKVAAIVAALRARLVNGLITDEKTAALVLAA